jgi:hypothetical protein
MVRAPERRSHHLGWRNRVAGWFCDVCGEPIPADPEAFALLTKLAQLSAFGLAADDRPILERPGEGD